MQEAKLYLAEALISLMEHTPLAEIKVKDLAKKAGVSRMSYYRYFSSKEEILYYYMDHIFQEYTKKVDCSKASQFQSYQHILESLLFFQNYRSFVQCLYNAHMERLLLDTLNRYVEKQAQFDKEKLAKSYPFYFYAGALYNIYTQWILNDPDIPAEKIAHMIVSILRHG